MTRCGILVGNPRPGGRTTRVALAIAQRLGVNHLDLIELGELGSAVLDPLDERVAEALDSLRSCDVAVVASPTYKATYSGLLKAFLDNVEAGGLRGKIAVPVMVGAGASHALAVEVHLRPLLSELGAVTPTRGLFVLESEIDRFEETLGDFASDVQFVRSLVESGRGQSAV